MNPTAVKTDNLCINTIRTLACDAVQKANSGHPGAPMGIAPMAYVLWQRHLRHNPSNPSWINRDRFILSAGHASMLIYSLLHLTGYKISIDDIKNFRQLHSRTPGHPEYGITPGVEMTTGPLGQGFATAVGMAQAEKILAGRFNKEDAELINHYTYVIASDGDLMEGISYEAASLAGHLKLGKLICLYDSNRISIDGSTDLTFSEDVKGRFTAAGWQVLEVADGDNDLDAVDKAIQQAQQETSKPSIIVVKTTIGYGSPNKQNSESSHGAPLGEDEVGATKEALGFDPAVSFSVPDEALNEMRKALQKGKAAEDEWNELLTRYRQNYADLAAELDGVADRSLPAGWEAALPVFERGEKLATRQASAKALNALSEKISDLNSGSADLSGSVGTVIKDGGILNDQNPSGRNVYYGVREHAMAAMVNGMTLHGGIRSACGTFLIFSDYMKPAVRLAALMGVPSIFIFSHDSVALGEDGPTHQPIEQIVGLRAIPNLNVIRPADGNETSAAWREALLRKDGPTAIITSRQGLPVVTDAAQALDGVSKGAYVIKNSDQKEALTIIATGSEVSLALEASEQLEEKGTPVRVVSMPCREIFERQSDAYKESVLPKTGKRLVVEAASSMGWHIYTGFEGKVISIDSFGTSAPGPVALDHFGFNVSHVVEVASSLAS